jgi:hypothetical protein
MSEPIEDPASPEPAPVEPPRPDPPPADPPPADPPRWVKSQVIGEGPAEEVPAIAPPVEATGPVPVRDQPAVTEEEISGARWFAVAFLAIVVPLGLVLFVVIVWGFIRLVVGR